MTQMSESINEVGFVDMTQWVWRELQTSTTWQIVLIT